MTELIFAIIIPEILLPFMENLIINAMRDPIITKRNKTDELNEFLESIDFNKLSVLVIKNLLSKRLF